MLLNVTNLLNMCRGQALLDPMRARQCLAPTNIFNFNPSVYILLLRYAQVMLHNATIPSEADGIRHVS